MHQSKPSMWLIHKKHIKHMKQEYSIAWKTGKIENTDFQIRHI